MVFFNNKGEIFKKNILSLYTTFKIKLYNGKG